MFCFRFWGIERTKRSVEVDVILIEVQVVEGNLEVSEQVRRIAQFVLRFTGVIGQESAKWGSA